MQMFNLLSVFFEKQFLIQILKLKRKVITISIIYINVEKLQEGIQGQDLLI